MKVKAEVNLKKGEIVDIDPLFSSHLVGNGWASIVPEHKTLEEKIHNAVHRIWRENSQDLSAKEVADIARDHFVEVAEKAAKRYGDYGRADLNGRSNYIINALKSDGK